MKNTPETTHEEHSSNRHMKNTPETTHEEHSSNKHMKNMKTGAGVLRLFTSFS